MYTLIRSSRRTISLQIMPSGQLVVRCPRRMSQLEVEAFVRSKDAWIQKNLKKMLPVQQRLTQGELQALAAQAKTDLPRRVALFAGQMGVSYGRITIRSQRTRWGSCSVKGNLNFNCLLMLCPEAVRDYVVVHELCHLREMNHSARFWVLVAEILPDYRTPKNWLKEQGNALIERLPDSY